VMVKTYIFHRRFSDISHHTNTHLNNLYNYYFVCVCLREGGALAPSIGQPPLVCTEYIFVYSAHCLLYKSVSMYCPYVNCFCTVWSTLSIISLNKAHVLW